MCNEATAATKGNGKREEKKKREEREREEGICRGKNCVHASRLGCARMRVREGGAAESSQCVTALSRFSAKVRTLSVWPSVRESIRLSPCPSLTHCTRIRTHTFIYTVIYSNIYVYVPSAHENCRCSAPRELVLLLPPPPTPFFGEIRRARAFFAFSARGQGKIRRRRRYMYVDTHSTRRGIRYMRARTREYFIRPR